MGDAAPGVALRGVSKRFETGVQAVAELHLEFFSGRLTALLGPTGCGKTTILRIVGGLEKPDTGSVEFDPPSPTLGFCFQEPRLLPWRDVYGNVCLPLELAHVDRVQRSRVVDLAIELVGLTDVADRLPATLSGGMRMRVALARTLVTEPKLLLLDEPFGALDEVTRFQLDEDVANLVRGGKVTALLVTHSITEAVFLADEVIVLSSRPAQVVSRFEVKFPVRDAKLRGTSHFATLTARIYESLRSGMENDR